MSSVTLVHPDKAVGRYEMPFGRDTGVVRGKNVLDRGAGPARDGGDLEFSSVKMNKIEVSLR